MQSTPDAGNAGETSPARVPWYRTVLAQAALGNLLLYLALPPWDRYFLWPLAWVAPVPWLFLVLREQWPPRSKDAARGSFRVSWKSLLRVDRLLRRSLGAHRRPYRAVWWSSFLFWMVAVHWIRMPHPLTYLGWVLLCFYLAFYLPVFIGLSRVAVHSCRIPLVVAAPVAWTGLELVRAHLMTGFLMAALGHTQYRWLTLIQVSDLGGAYAVSFLVMLVAACLTQLVQAVLVRKSFARTLIPVAVAGSVIAAALGYGRYRLQTTQHEPGPRIALVQEAITPTWDYDPSDAFDIFRRHFVLSKAAVEASDEPLDLIVWPETMFREPLILVAEGYTDQPERLARIQRQKRRTQMQAAMLAQKVETPLLVGIDTVEFSEQWKTTRLGYVHYNSVAGFTRSGELVGRYDKMHRVPYGEYLPPAEWLPFLYDLTPLPAGVQPGEQPQALAWGGYRYAPNICYESTVPHVIRRQVNALRAAGEEPDILVNVTNDGWFRGSSELDMHRTCSIFRAVECRKPVAIAANGGITGAIDSCGRIIRQLPRLEPNFLIVEPPLDARRSPYLVGGDWLAGSCFAACLLFAGVGVFQLRRARRSVTP